MEFTATTQITAGSEKQIAWATDIRARVISEINTYIADTMTKHAASFAAMSDVDRATLQADYDRAQAALNAKTDAAWWINTARHMAATQIMARAGKGTL